MNPFHPSAIEGRTVRHAGYAVRQRVEEIFGWLKAVGPCRQTHSAARRG
jgi:hypothetical protein